MKTKFLHFLGVISIMASTLILSKNSVCALDLVDVKTEFISCSQRAFRKDVDAVNEVICELERQQGSKASIAAVSPAVINQRFEALFDQGIMDCKVAANYFKQRLDTCEVPNFLLHLVFEGQPSHLVNLYLSDRGWRIADFIQAQANKTLADRFFEFPIESYIDCYRANKFIFKAIGIGRNLLQDFIDYRLAELNKAPKASFKGQVTDVIERKGIQSYFASHKCRYAVFSNLQDANFAVNLCSSHEFSLLDIKFIMDNIDHLLNSPGAEISSFKDTFLKIKNRNFSGFSSGIDRANIEHILILWRRHISNKTL